MLLQVSKSQNCHYFIWLLQRQFQGWGQYQGFLKATSQWRRVASAANSAPGVRPWTHFFSPKVEAQLQLEHGAQVFISPKSPKLFTDTRRWTGQGQMSKCCTLGVLSFQSCSEWVWHHFLPWQARPWGKERTNNSHTPRTWFTLALHQLSVPLHFSPNLCESDLRFLSGIWLAAYVSNKIKHGDYNCAPAIMDENSEVSSDRSERDRSLPDAKSPHCWRQWSMGLP